MLNAKAFPKFLYIIQIQIIPNDNDEVGDTI